MYKLYRKNKDIVGKEKGVVFFEGDYIALIQELQSMMPDTCLGTRYLLIGENLCTVRECVGQDLTFAIEQANDKYDILCYPQDGKKFFLRVPED